MEQQDMLNDLATAARALYVEQVASAGYLLGLASNGKKPTLENTKPYTLALNKAIAECYAIMRAMGMHIGKTPQASFNPDRKCDDRCKNARGFECHCACGGLGHRMNTIGTRKKIAA